MNYIYTYETFKKLMERLAEEDNYNLAVEIRQGVQQFTCQSIAEWGGEFQIISDISYAFLKGEDWKDIDLSLINPDLTVQKVQEIIDEAVKRLGFVMKSPKKCPLPVFMPERMKNYIDISKL